MRAALRTDQTWLIAAAAVTALALGAWWQVPAGAFQYDDHQGVMTSAEAPSRAAFVEAWRGGFRPLLRVSYLADRRLWGDGARGFLVTNLAIHLACVLAVLALARRRNLAALGAMAAAFAFALQPAQSEAVAYVSGRSSSLATLFLLAGLLCHDAAAAARGRARRIRLALALAAFAAAVAVKEIALVFPLLVAVWEIARRDRRVAEIRPLLFAYAAAWLAVAGLALGSGRLRALVEYSLAAASPLEALAANLAAAPHLLSLWARPGALAIEHPTPAAGPAAVAVGAALLALSLVAGWRLARRAPAAALALLWVPAALAPTNSLVWKLDPVSERSLYLAWVGPALALGAAVEAMRCRVGSRRALRLGAAALGCAALAGGALLVRQRVEVWSDSRSLWRDAVASAPRSVRAWNNLGMAYWEHDEPAPARAAFRRALELAPGDALARQNLYGLALSSAGEPDPAEPALAEPLPSPGGTR